MGKCALGAADAQAIADPIVDSVVRGHRVTGSLERPNGSGSSFAEYRTRSLAGEHSFGDSYAATWWKYVAELGDERRHLLTETEHRTMSKATGAAGVSSCPMTWTRW